MNNGNYVDEKIKEISDSIERSEMKSAIRRNEKIRKLRKKSKAGKFGIDYFKPLGTKSLNRED